MAGYSNPGGGTTGISSPLITFGVVAPASTPGKVGDIYINTAAPGFYYAKGTVDSTDWVLVAND